jgi:hypothetical protein
MREFSENIEDCIFPSRSSNSRRKRQKADYSKPVLNLNQAIPNYPPLMVIKKAIIDETEKKFVLLLLLV